MKNEFNEFLKEIKEEWENYDYNSFYPINLMFILAEMEEDIIEELMEWLKDINGEECDFWLGDILTEELWYVFYKLAKIDICKLEKYVYYKTKSEIQGMFVKSAILRGFYRLQMEDTGKRGEVLKILRNIIIDNEEDPELRADAMMIASEMGAEEIRKEIEENFKKIEEQQRLISFECLTFVKEKYSEEFYGRDLEKIYTDFKKYITEEYEYENEEKEIDTNELLFGNQKENLQQLKSNKIGRNEPCPCGSGKKYKKCCGK